MSRDEEKVDVGSLDLLEEPRFLDRVTHRSDDACIAVPGEIEEERKTHDSDAEFRLVVGIALGERLHDTGTIEVDVRCQVPPAPVGCEIVVRVVGNLRGVELVVTNGEKIVREALEDRQSQFAIGYGDIPKPGPVVEVSRIDQQQVDAEVVSFGLHLPDEIGEVAIVGAVVLIQQMARQPSVGVGGVEEVELAPVQVFDLLGRGFQRRGLDSLVEIMAPHQVMVYIASKDGRCPIVVLAGTNLEWAKERRGRKERCQQHSGQPGTKRHGWVGG